MMKEKQENNTKGKYVYEAGTPKTQSTDKT